MGLGVVRAGALAVLLAIAAGGCGDLRRTSDIPAAPKLVLFIAIDGLPERQLMAHRDQLAPDGFRRFLDRGAWFSEARYGHAYTVTAAGHAAMLTGAYPHRTGIIANAWLDPVTGETTNCVGDTRYTYLGNATQPLDGTSPANLRVETLGDVLRHAHAASKVIAISGKDRGAILVAGKAGTAYVYMARSGEFASSTYYMQTHPAWVQAFNVAKPADRYFHAEWRALLPEGAYAGSLPDDEPWFRKKVSLPMTIGAESATPDAAFHTALLMSPFIDALSLDFARAAIRGESLGGGDGPDILAVSLSGHDYVNHSFGAESRFSHDHLLQLDRQLDAFFRDVDAMVGRDRYVAVLTSDHGYMPAVDYRRALGEPSGRVDATATVDRINGTLAARFGEGKWVKALSGRSLLLDRALAAQRGLDLDVLAEEVRRVALEDPGIVAAYTRRELLDGSRAGAPFFAAVRNAYDPERSGDVQFVLAPYWMLGSGDVATHGSPYEYDTHVPMLFWGPAWVTPGRVDAPVEVVDIAPTLAKILGVPTPAASEGRLLPIVVH